MVVVAVVVVYFFVYILLFADCAGAPHQCSERNNVTSCLCDLGFHGKSCEKIDFDGSGNALSFSGGSDPVLDVVAWDLTSNFSSLLDGALLARNEHEPPTIG